MKRLLLIFFILMGTLKSFTQKVDSIFVDLYTDSLKKGTYNYINIDGRIAKRFIPLDTSQIIFTSTDGKFFGNNLWIEPQFSGEKITITATLKSNPALTKEFTMYIKKKADDEQLKTMDDIMKEGGNAAPKHLKKKH